MILEARDLSSVGKSLTNYHLNLFTKTNKRDKRDKRDKATHFLPVKSFCFSAIGELGGTPVYVMPVSCENSPYRSPPHLGAARPPVPPLLTHSDVSGLCSIQIVEEPEEKFR